MGPALDALALQAELMSAWYWTGDGSGVAVVNPATSCVQDSSQSLWIALHTAGDRVGDLGRALDTLLTPFGMVRSDWRRNAELSRDAGSQFSANASAGTGRKPIDGAARAGFASSQRTADTLLSLRSMVPQQALL